jgi:receptor protein-tyrosine kinase
MSDSRTTHLVERAVQRMAELGIAGASGGAPAGLRPPPDIAEPATREPAQAPPAGSGNGAAKPAPASPDAVSVETVSVAAMEAAGLMVAGTHRSRIAEEWNVTAGRLIRTMRTVRRDTPGNTANNLLLVTSSKPNEGKSFSAINLAGSLTLGRMAEVLLTDLDSKPGALTEVLGLSGRPGLFDLAADPSLRLDELVLATAIPGLTILPIGRAARDGPGSSDRAITSPVVAAIEMVARRFPERMVILDSAPCLATSDASTLASAVGQIAMIVEAERTQRDDLEAALEMLRPCANITLVLNKVRPNAAHSFGDYYYYNG